MSFQDRPMSQPDLDPEDVSNTLLRNTRCCFCFPCFGSRGSSTVGVAWWQRIHPSQSHRHEDRWWTRAFLKIREWSEIVAGPRWKTFIRRFNRNRGGGDGRGGDRHGHGQFQYDALSYAMNFDEGPGEGGDFDEDREYGGFRSFSTRYAAVPPWNKKSKGGGSPKPSGSSGKGEVTVA